MSRNLEHDSVVESTEYHEEWVANIQNLKENRFQLGKIDTERELNFFENISTK